MKATAVRDAAKNATSSHPPQQPTDIERELSRVETEKKPPTHGTFGQKFSFALGAGLVLLFVALRLFLPWENFALLERHRAFLESLLSAAILSVFVWLSAGLVQVYVVDRLEDAVSRYNLNRIMRLITALLLLLIALSLLFSHWYTAAVSLGLVSLVLGLALQAPLSSFFAWFYILVRRPYHVGDRIKIGDSTGDVIEVGYLDTILWEFGGDYLSSDHPSGRIIKFPNSTVFDKAVYNYSWPLFPYVWNEIKFHIAYDSDLDFVADTMKRIVEQELGSEMIKHVKTYRQLLSQTPVDELEVREHPSVFFRVNDNTWLEAIVRYLVHPKQAGRTKNILIKKLLSRLNDHPDKVLFPKGNQR